MSYDIKVESPHQNLSMNWLRNPFGLCNFAEDNVGDGDQSLWHVCNDYSYDRSNDIDRKKFLRVVEDYWDRLRGLQRGFFHFSFRAYVQFVSDHPALIQQNVLDPNFEWIKSASTLKVDVEQFQHCRNLRFDQDKTVLDLYKNWFDELVILARAMQDPEATVYISN